MPPRLLDLFCGVGGAAMGYHQAGFDVVGVDINPQPHYPFEFIQADVFTLTTRFLQSFDLIHASPPCKRHSRMQGQHGKPWPDLVTPTLLDLTSQSKPWVLENVPGAPFEPDFYLCGSMFRLRVRRHRWFRTSFPVKQPECNHAEQGRVVQVNGHPGGSSTRDGRRHSAGDWRIAMQIEWVTAREISQAIRPAYTAYIANQWKEES